MTTVDLTPDLINQVSEGSLDTSLVNNHSIQRTLDCVFVVNGQNVKQVHRIADGKSYDETSFETVVNDNLDSKGNRLAGHPTFSSGTAVSRDPVTSGHPTANLNSGSTF